MKNDEKDQSYGLKGLCKERPVFGQNVVIRGCQEQEVPQLPLQT